MESITANFVRVATALLGKLCLRIVFAPLLGVLTAFIVNAGSPVFAQSAKSDLNPLSVELIDRSIEPFDTAGDYFEISDQIFIRTHRALKVGVVRGSQPPYQFFDKRRGLSGLSIEFLQMVSDSIGFEVEFILFDDLSALLSAMESRQIDIIPSLESTAERRSSMLFTSGVTPNPAALVARVNDRTLADNPFLADVRVGVDPNSEALTNLTLQFPHAIPVSIGTSEEALDKILAGEITFYYGPVLRVFALEEPSLLEQLEVKQRVYFGTGWNHIAVRSDWSRVASLYERYISNGRSVMDEKLADVLGERLARQLPPVSMTPFQSAWLSGFSSLKVGALREFVQINGVDSNKNHIGIASEFTAFVAYQLGLTLKIFAYDTAAEMQHALQRGEIDLIPHFDDTFERRRQFTFSDPYMSMSWLLVGNTSHAQYWDLASLGDSRIALRTEHPLAPWIARNYPQIEIVFTDTAYAAFEMVSSGDAEAVIEMKLFTNRMLNSEFGGSLRALDEIEEVQGRFGFASTTVAAPLIPLINGALSQMDDALRNRMIRRWIAVDFRPEARLKKILSVLVPIVILLAVLSLAVLYWNRRIAQENFKRRQAEQLLTDMTDRLRTGVFQVRQFKGKPLILEFSNALAREMIRLSPIESANKDSNIFDYIDAEDRDWVKQKLRACMSSGQHFRETFRFNFPDNQKGWILADGHCRVEADGANVWSTYLFDLTSERLLTEELNELLMMRDEFMSVSGHELRTPLQSLSLALECITEDKEPARINAMLGTARSAVSDLIELVDDFVELSSMNSRALALNKELYDFHNLTKSLNRTFSNVATNQSIRFDYAVDDAVPQLVWGDPMRVKQIIYNLLGNAFKYTDEGLISFHIRLKQSNAPDSEESENLLGSDKHLELPASGPVWVEIVIRDTGIGIAAEHVPSIFQPFNTVGPSSRKSTGLGLAIVDRITAVLGGNIQVNTEQGIGSEFVLSLPLHIEKPDNVLARQSAFISGDIEKTAQSRNLLVVDDNLLVRETLASLLQFDGWNVLQAESALSALPILESIDCAALITDQKMPGMTGIELARAVLYRSEKLGNRPVMIMMSGGMPREEAHQANDVFDAVLFKPIKAAQIRQSIASASAAKLASA